MTPRTRSGGAAPPSSIIYKSTPALKQLQFPSRRRRVRTYGRQNRRAGGGYDGNGNDDDDKENQEGSSTHPTPNLKQKTLTQYDFASGFNEGSLVDLSDASDVEIPDKIEDDNTEKENNVPKGTKRRRSPTAKHAPLQPIEVLEDEEAEDAEEELRVPDTEAEEDDDDDEEPIVRGRRGGGFVDTRRTKRRRTLGEEHRMSAMNENSRSSRRRTLGDSPVAGPSRRRYHTQTLTQFIGRTTSFVADSEDEELGGSRNHDFLEWLGDEEPQSPTMGTQASKRSAETTTFVAVPKVWEDHSPSPRPRTRKRPVTTQNSQQPREESVVPQTPIKSLRFGLPPSSQRISPSPSRIAAIYGAPNPHESPSTQRRRQNSPPKPLLELTGKPTKRISSTIKPELVIADSYATEAWSPVGGAQARLGTPSQTQGDVFGTPAEESGPHPTAVPATSLQTNRPTDNDEEPAPATLCTQNQDGEIQETFSTAISQVAQESPVVSRQTLPKTTKQDTPSQPRAAPTLVATGDEREIPDSDDDEDDFGTDSDTSSDEAEEARFAAGAETQLLMDQLQSSVHKWSGTSRAGASNAPSSSLASAHSPRTSSPVPSSRSANTPQSAPPSSAKPAAAMEKQPLKQPPQSRPGTIANDIPSTHRGRPLRTPLYHPEPIDTQGAPLESQRVALATLQSFTPASARTDILLPVSHGTVANLISGHQDAVVLPFKVPVQVARFWLLHDGVLRYVAFVAGHSHDPTHDNGRGGRGTWAYRAVQVYELNNPTQEDDMRAEDWIHGHVARYVYFPPAVVSQLLWNLRQALFEDPDDDVDAAATTTPPTVALSSSSPLRRSARLSMPPSSRGGCLPSSPLQQRQRQHARPPPSTMPAPPRPPRRAAARKYNTQQPLVRPSQATTVSQASTTASSPSSPAPDVVAGTVNPVPASYPRRNCGADESSESLVFGDHGGSSVLMPYSEILGLESLKASQLLTGSQILPESLVRDEEEQQHAPDEIWDSEEE
ncbi:hypothetical protein IF1G_05923 [Cordyceps javanica]|uniref:Uncharacterized protein n=1 Tax=Cordyceps javanica TaxID=43265 RepID=A0A545UZP9_9HYPO|nr:hypothetical protein IF1G_05923 [Cordyceps javanica]TQW05850.1 hypothetical protein IF2G_06972 [Cordyceps javanica]